MRKRVPLGLLLVACPCAFALNPFLDVNNTFRHADAAQIEVAFTTRNAACACRFATTAGG